MGHMEEAAAIMVAAADRLQTDCLGAAGQIRQSASEVAGYLNQAGEQIYSQYEARIAQISDLATQVSEIVQITADEMRTSAGQMGRG